MLFVMISTRLLQKIATEEDIVPISIPIALGID
jgi:hypothetical protein